MAADSDPLARWARIRRKGPLRFILLRGVLGWGLVAALVYSLVMWAVAGANLRVLLPLSMVIFPIGGVLWGAALSWMTAFGMAPTSDKVKAYLALHAARPAVARLQAAG